MKSKVIHDEEAVIQRSMNVERRMENKFVYMSLVLLFKTFQIATK